MPATDPQSIRDATPHERFRRGGRRRYLVAAALAVLAVILFAVFGPDREDVKKRFEFSGVEGPLKVMPELSIDEGVDARFQEAMRRKDLPEPSPRYEVLEDDHGPEPVPKESEASPDTEAAVEESDDPELDEMDLVDMRLPAQSNPWFRLVRMVRPRYPADATAQDRMLPLVLVEVAFYVSPSGTIEGAYIISNEGSDAFARVTLKAVEEWLYEPISADVAPQGFWNRLTLRFRQPTATLHR